MTQIQFLNDAGTVGFHYVFWASVLFVLGVSTFWPWWKTDLGWTIVLKTACIAAILFPFFLHLILGVNVETLFWEWWRLITFFMVGNIIVWRFFVILIIQRYNPPPVKSGRHYARGWLRRIVGRGDKRSGKSKKFEEATDVQDA